MTPMPPIAVGDLAIQPVLDGTAYLGTDLFTGSDWSDHGHLLAEDGRLHVPVGAFVVRSAGRTVLLDAGVGRVDDDEFIGGLLLESLRAVGVAPGDIDAVVVSHLHTDHVGWLLEGDVERDGLVFPNATVHIGALEWDHFVTSERGGRRRAARLRGIEHRVSLVESEGTVVAPGITTLATPGHTPGHMSVVVSSGRERMIVLGDVLHCPAQLTHSEWEFFWDVDKALAVRTREAMLREAEDPHTALLPAHFPGLQAGRLVAGQGPASWVLG
jgi:glyoxylase-like metal-dependent hydrolase (beta-lactamase superfamily II)